MDTFTQTEKLLEKTYFCVDEAFEGFEIKSFLYSYLRYIPDAGYTWTQDHVPTFLKIVFQINSEQ